MRLDRYLVSCGVGTRTEVKNYLKNKWIKVDGEVVTIAKTQIDENKVKIDFKDEELLYEEFSYYMLNKPKGVVSATEDRDFKTVLDLLDDSAKQKKVFPVGRLDKDTTGLLLLTNDGDLAHKLLSPRKHVDKVYIAKILGVMTKEDIVKFKNGISLNDFTCKPAFLKILDSDRKKEQSWVEITISEGKFHQVKRMVAACGKEVITLKRLKMGSLSLDEGLPEGGFRRLTEVEIKNLKNESIKE